MSTLVLLFRLLLMNLFILTIYSCFHVFKTLYGSTPQDLTIKEGESFLFNCTLEKSTAEYNGMVYKMDSSMLVIKHDNSRLVKGIRVVNNSSIEYKVNKSVMKDKGYYFCYVDIAHPFSNTSDLKLLCATKVFIGKPPQEIGQDHFRCISESLLNLTCSWDAPDTGIKTKYTLSMLYLNSIPYSKCPTKLNSTACLFTLRDPYPYRIGDPNLSFNLTASNKFGNFSEIFRIDHYKIIRPGIPQNFSSTFHNSTSIFVSWVHSKGLQYERLILPDLRYQLTITQLSAHSQPNVSIIDNIYNLSNYEINNLIPNTMYEIKLRCRIRKAIGDHFWSPFVTINVETNSDTPFLSPSIVAGSFDNVINEDGSRDVTIFWTPVDLIYMNAPNFTYKIFLIYSNNSIYQSLNVNQSHFFHRFSQLSCNLTYKFEIRSQNEKGISQAFNQLLIEKCSSLIVKPKYSIGIDNENSSLTLYWSPLSSLKTSSNITFTIHWCKVFQVKFSCATPLSFLNLNSSLTTSTTLNLDPSAGFKVAISANSQNLSSGLKWFNCILSKHSFLSSNQLKHFDLKPINSNSIQASWIFECPSFQLFIHQFEIHYCKSINSLFCSNFSITSDSQNVTIHKLDSNSVYDFNLIAHTTFGKLSLTKSVKTQIDAKSMVITIVTTLVIVIFFIIIFYLGLFCIKKKLKQEKEIKKDIKKNWVPKMPTKLQGVDVDFLLNPLCHYENRPQLPSQYENRQYMNPDKKNSNILASSLTPLTSSSHSLTPSSSHEVISSSSIQTSSKHQVEKIEITYPCESEDSGYMTKASTTTTNEIEDRNDEEDELDEMVNRSNQSDYIITSFRVPNKSDNFNSDYYHDYHHYISNCEKPYNGYVLE